MVVHYAMFPRRETRPLACLSCMQEKQPILEGYAADGSQGTAYTGGTVIKWTYLQKVSLNAFYTYESHRLLISIIRDLYSS